MSFCCYKVRRDKVPQRRDDSQTKEEPLIDKSHVPPESQEAIVKPEHQSKPAAVDPGEVTFRPRSASEPHRNGKRIQKPRPTSQTPSLKYIPEETTSNTLQTASGTSQNLTSKSTLSCISGLSDGSSAYHTPLSVRYFVPTLKEDSDHPQPVKMEGTEWERRKQHHMTSSESVLSSVSKRSEHNVVQFYHTLMERLEKAEKDNTELRETIEQERMKQHTELMKLTQRLQELETEKCREKQEATTPDREGLIKNTASQLPQNCSVSTDVLVGLAKRMTQWKFLARRLHIEEHDIQQIGVDFPGSIQEQSYQMLLKWKLSLSSNNTSYHTLGEAVRQEFGETLYCDYVDMVREAETAVSD